MLLRILRICAALIVVLAATPQALAQFGNPNAPVAIPFDDSADVGVRSPTSDPDIFLCTGFMVRSYEGEDHVIGVNWREDASGDFIDNGAWVWVVGHYDGPVTLNTGGELGLSWKDDMNANEYFWTSSEGVEEEQYFLDFGNGGGTSPPSCQSVATTITEADVLGIGMYGTPLIVVRQYTKENYAGYNIRVTTTTLNMDGSKTVGEAIYPEGEDWISIRIQYFDSEGNLTRMVLMHLDENGNLTILMDRTEN